MVKLRNKNCRQVWSTTLQVHCGQPTSNLGSPTLFTGAKKPSGQPRLHKLSSSFSPGCQRSCPPLLITKTPRLRQARHDRAHVCDGNPAM
jgi:hypothetical protein